MAQQAERATIKSMRFGILNFSSRRFRTLVIATLVLLVCASCSKEAAEEPAVGFPLLGGGYADVLGEERIVFLNYWAVWCGPCIAEMPELAEFSHLYQDRAIVYAINWDGVDEVQLGQDVESLGVEIPSIINDPGVELSLPRPMVLPTTYILKAGELKETLVGPQTIDSMQELLSKWEAL